MDGDVDSARRARALNEQLEQAFQAGHMDEARAVARQIVDTYGSAVEAALEPQLNYATYYLAHFCYVGGETAEGWALTLKLYHRWEADLEEERLALEAGYLLTLAQDLVGSREPVQALELYRLIGKRLEGAAPPTLRRPRALALAGEVGMLGQVGRLEEAQDAAVKLAGEYGEDALAAYDEQLARLDVPDPAPEQLALRALALYNKAGLLMNLGRIEEAKILFTAIVEQYDGEDSATVPALAEQARETLRALDD